MLLASVQNSCLCITSTLWNGKRNWSLGSCSQPHCRGQRSGKLRKETHMLTGGSHGDPIFIEWYYYLYIMTRIKEEMKQNIHNLTPYDFSHFISPLPLLPQDTRNLGSRLRWAEGTQRMGEERAWERKGLGPERRVSFTRRDSVQWPWYTVGKTGWMSAPGWGASVLVNRRPGSALGGN